MVATAAHGSLPDPAHGGCLDAEVVVRGQAGTRSDVPLSVGLAHWDEVMDVRHLERLRRILDLLAARGEDVAQVRPACYSGAGFTTESSDRLPRESRTLMFVGYLLLSVTILHWLEVIHQPSSEMLGTAAFYFVGLPLAVWLLVRRIIPRQKAATAAASV